MDSNYARELIKKTKNDFDKIANEFSKTRKTLWPELLELDKYIKDNEKVLDLGCGNGRLFELFSVQGRSVSGGKKVDYVGIDNSSNLISEAKKKYGNYFQVADILNIPFSDNYFDSIWLIAVFHHIPSKELRLEVLKEMARVLKKKGLIIVTCWNFYQLRYIKLLLKYFFRKIFTKSKLDFKDILVSWGREGIDRYYHAFSRRELKKLFKKAGFKIKESKYLKRNNKKTNILIIAEL